MVAVIAALELASNRTRINSDRQLMRQAIREIRERQMSEATWEEKFRFMQSEYDRLLPAYMEAKAENDRLRAALEAEKAESATFRHGLRLANERYEAAVADKLAAVKRAIERAAVVVRKWEYAKNAACAIETLDADEIARGEG